MKTNGKTSVFYAILAALLYALSAPFSKLLLREIPPTMLAAFLYLGAGIGLSAIGLFKKKTGTELPLTKTDLPYIAAMVFLDIAAPILLLIGLSRTPAATVSLLNNFEIAATALFALLLFKEAISGRLWIAIACVTVSSILLSLRDGSSFSFSVWSLLVPAACVCWGMENNCTRKLSSKNPLQIVVIKGLFSGSGALAVALFLNEPFAAPPLILAALCLGLISYGFSIYFYIRAQRNLGAAKTSAYYAVAPFFSAALSFLILREKPTVLFGIALVFMMAGVCLSSSDR